MLESTVTALYPKFDRAKSFAGKALIKEVRTDTAHTVTLQSYTTDVVIIDRKAGTITIHGPYTVTTCRHIREFCRQYANYTNTELKVLRKNDGRPLPII